LSIYVLGRLTHVLLLLFAAVLLAIAVGGVARLIGRYSPLSPVWSLAGTYLLILMLTAGMAALVWPQAAEQLPKLAEQLPQAVNQIAGAVERMPLVSPPM
jgi:predicted PurR-regulated permease PerM